MTDSSQHRARLRAYFDGVGFERWAAIYGKSDLSRVRKTIREGHREMMAQADAWIAETVPNIHEGLTALDAGCGTGLFSLALARRGFQVTAADIAPQMVEEARRQAQREGFAERITFRCSDIESLSGRFDVVTCFDVLVHYPQALFGDLCGQLARLSSGPLFFTYAPYNSILAALHWVGGRFPQSQRRTNIQMIPDAYVDQALAAAGKRVYRRARISSGFYHVTLLEAH